ncbi:polysaccharide lyase [Flagellimonas flava]|uniref:Polysaccharide lyase 14 domain-containing protein n=1 Tax=Flagellimonas flava TaxID=570519 RepID=A0A1M5NM17_9FLAO|nr:hypothetical protein [Allomuricauda flava]SHG90552.1 hypothetical protein SAMN04488116_2873 [Allomuricauda flava]
MKTTKVLKTRFWSYAVGTMCLAVMISSCEKENLEAPLIEDSSENTLARAVYSNRTVGFNKSDQTYTNSMATSDFGSIGGWSSGEAGAYIRANALRITLKKNKVGSGSGMNSTVNVSDGTEYEVEFKVKFNSGFEWSRGGKMGWGFSIGNGVTGCNGDDARAGQGGSVRCIWYAPDMSKGDNNGTAYFRPGVYSRGMPDDCAENFGAKWPSSSSLQTGVWYTVKIYYKQNTSNSSQNGKLKMWVNGNKFLDKSNMWWSDNSNNRKVEKLLFNTFRGGSSSTWEANNDHFVRFDYVKWKRLAS